MNKWEKEVTQSLLDSEQEALDALEQQYAKALRDIGDKVKQFEYDIARLDDALQEEGIDDTERGLLESRKRAKVYQKTYQEALQGQVSGIVDKLHADEYKTIDEYLQTSYDDSFIGELYNLQKQGVPVVFPIDQKAAVRAILTNSKLSAGLYARLGIDLQQMKTDVSREITRGIASAMTYKDIARNIKNVSGVSMGRAKTIARTEGHRIQEESRQEVRLKAREIGADQVKQWDSALDAKTRDSHVKLDGQIREIDEPFEVDGKKAMHPGEFGRPEEDINCRCRSNTRARWALSANETKHLGNVEDMSLEQKQEIANKLKVPVDELDKYSGQIVPIKAKDYEDFKRQYGEYWHYEGSTLQKEAEARIAGYKTLGKAGKASVEQLRRKVATDGHEIIDKPTYKKLTKSFVSNGGIIIGGADAEKHLKDRAYASYLPGLNTAFIRDDATVSDVLEEMYHAEQDRKNMFGSALTHKVIIKREIDAQKHLLSLTERYKIPLEEVNVTKQNLAYYEEILEKLSEGDD